MTRNHKASLIAFIGTVLVCALVVYSGLTSPSGAAHHLFEPNRWIVGGEPFVPGDLPPALSGTSAHLSTPARHANTGRLVHNSHSNDSRTTASGLSIPQPEHSRGTPGISGDTARTTPTGTGQSHDVVNGSRVHHTGSSAPPPATTTLATAPVATAPGSTTPGSTTPGSTTPGSTGPVASTAPDGTSVDSGTTQSEGGDDNQSASPPWIVPTQSFSFSLAGLVHETPVGPLVPATTAADNAAAAGDPGPMAASGDVGGGTDATHTAATDPGSDGLVGAQHAAEDDSSGDLTDDPSAISPPPAPDASDQPPTEAPSPAANFPSGAVTHRNITTKATAGDRPPHPSHGGRSRGARHSASHGLAGRGARSTPPAPAKPHKALMKSPGKAHPPVGVATDHRTHLRGRARRAAGDAQD